jgi:hypothetical protein
VTKEEAKQKAVDYWLSKAKESLAAASDEAAAGRLSFAINPAILRCSTPPAPCS